MLKKAGIVVAASTAGVLALSPLAFAVTIPGVGDIDLPVLGDGSLLNISDIAVQTPIQACNNSVIEGVLGVLAKDQSNEDSHDGTCKQKNSATDNHGNGGASDGDDDGGDDDGGDDDGGDDDGGDDDGGATDLPTDGGIPDPGTPTLPTLPTGGL